MLGSPASLDCSTATVCNFNGCAVQRCRLVPSRSEVRQSAGDGVYSKTAQRVHLRAPVAFLSSGSGRSLRLSPWVLSLVLSAKK